MYILSYFGIILNILALKYKLKRNFVVKLQFF